MLRKSLNWFFSAASIGICIVATGCCGPVGCGIGCNLPGDGCQDCDGSYTASRPIPHGPIDALRQMKRSLVCGGGCGEVYYGEWMSTPPDACDPCQGEQWVGGATKCRPFCWQPGLLFRNFYGGRYCDGSELVDDCGCGGVGCDHCDSGYHGPGHCATCDAAAAAGQHQQRMAEPARHIPTQMVQQQRVNQQRASQQMRRTAQRMQPNQTRTTRQTNTMYR